MTPRKNTITFCNGTKYMSVEVPSGTFRIPHVEADLCFSCYWLLFLKMKLALLTRSFKGGKYADASFKLCHDCAENFESVIPTGKITSQETA